MPLLVWSGISKDIKLRNDRQLPCLYVVFQTTAKGTITSYRVLSFLATDLLDYKGAQYLLVTVYYKKYPILRKLNSSTAAVINYLKSIFAEHGIQSNLFNTDAEGTKLCPYYRGRVSMEFSLFRTMWTVCNREVSVL